MALVRIEEHTFGRIERFMLLDPLLVPAEALPTALDTIHAAGVAVPEPSTDNEAISENRSIETIVRLVMTPLTLVGVPLYVVFVFGQSVLVTNGTVIVFVVGIVAIVQELR